MALESHEVIERKVRLFGMRSAHEPDRQARLAERLTGLSSHKSMPAGAPADRQ
jgi:hypothetical protein